jgi:hypothetical protein
LESAVQSRPRRSGDRGSRGAPLLSVVPAQAPPVSLRRSMDCRHFCCSNFLTTRGTDRLGSHRRRDRQHQPSGCSRGRAMTFSPLTSILRLPRVVHEHGGGRRCPVVREGPPRPLSPKLPPTRTCFDWRSGSDPDIVRKAKLPQPRTLHGDERCNCEQDNCGAIDICGHG